jgi:capsular exopolysaccharide synthesis family protein
MNDEQRSNFAEYIGVVKRSAWIVILAAVLATAAAYAISARQPKVYSANAEVLVPAAPLNLVLPGGNSTSTVQQARDAATLAQLAQTPGVAQGAVGALGGSVTAARLASMTSVASDPSTNVLTFTLRNRSRSFTIAAVNAYADAFARYENSERVQAIDSALASVAAQIATTKREAAQSGKGQQFTYAQTLAKLAAKQEALASAKAVTASSPATISKRAGSAAQVAPTPSKDALLGLAGGIVLGIGLAALRHLLDTKVRTADDVARAIDLPLLGRLSTPPRSMRARHGVAMLSADQIALAEEFRKLRLSVDFANLGAKARSIIVTSAVSGEGKSTTVANLAIAYAQTGRRVIAVDMDLRRPQLHLFFDVQGAPGMTEVLLGSARLDQALVPVDIGPADPQPMGAASEGSLHVMHAGPVPPNPATLAESSAVGVLLHRLLQTADLVLLDSAPLLPVSDTLGLARHADAIVVLARSDIATRPALNDLRRTLGVCEATKLGFIFTGAEAEPGYGYSNYGSYHTALPKHSATAHAALPAQHNATETT